MSLTQNSNALDAVPFAPQAGVRAEQNGSSVVEALTAIWQRILRRSDVGPRDDFFALGGDPLKATELFEEIARTWGHEMPTTVIYHARTVTALAAMIQNPNPCILPAVFPLKTAGMLPPVFLASGLGGSMMEFFGVLRILQCDRQIYGLEALTADGMEIPFKSIEEMASAYLDSIRSVQPKGPYRFIGYSLGGLVMFEIAQRLLGMGEQIALLAMLDSYPHPRFLSRSQRLRLLGSRMRCHASIMQRLTIREKFSYLFSASRRVRYLTREPAAPGAQALRPLLEAANQRARENEHFALGKYQPSFYNGRIRFVRAAIGTVFPSNPQAVWGRLVNQFEVETMPGDHHGMVQTEFAALGAILSRYLRDADGQ